MQGRRGNVFIVDCPFLSDVPKALPTLLKHAGFGSVVFADVCKEGTSPLAASVCRLQRSGDLPAR